MLREFRDFVARGNVIDLAVGVVVGAAFGKIVTSFVEGIIMPPLGLILGRIDFSALFYTLERSKGIPTSLAEAKAHLSALVDEAEHHHKRILILRHGKPAAAIVPVHVAVPPKRRLSAAEIEEAFAGLGAAAPQASAVGDLLSGRR